jgi:exopolysaccharide biosynthesis polyprenyl glycosylphosphotransferase
VGPKLWPTPGPRSFVCSLTRPVTVEGMNSGSRGASVGGGTSTWSAWGEGMSVAHSAYAESAADAPRILRHGRGWLVRRSLLCADVVGLIGAFVVAEALFGENISSFPNRIGVGIEFLGFLLTLPVWVAAAKLYGLYERDEERADHSTVDDLTGIFHLVTVGTWFVFLGTHLTGTAAPPLSKMVMFWASATVIVTGARAFARSVTRHTSAFVQNTIIVGAGDVGQLLARKLQLHPEYGIRVLGFIDSDPREQRRDIPNLKLLGELEDLRAIVRELSVERVIVAFSNESHERLLHHARALRDMGVQIDLVPRLFEAVGPRAGLHTVEGLPLIGLPPVRLSRSSRIMKRAVDLLVAGVLLVLLAPLFAYIAIRVKRDSPGPVFFRQQRLGFNQREFTALKFRTMYADTDESYHRQRVAQTMSPSTAAGAHGLYKLEDSSAITPFGRWLRRSSLDELPQLINILRGEMSLVGPRPCIPYEVEHFKEHQFERFLVPQGLTGLWQVTARSCSSFGEALEMDVTYARGWSFWLDMRLLFRTIPAVLRQRGAV